MLRLVSTGPKPSLAEARPDLAAEWHQDLNDPLGPGAVTCGVDRKVWWTCPRGHDYQAAIYHRVRNASGCPYCADRRVLKGFNDLTTTHPYLALEWHPTRNGDRKPETVIAGANVKRWWLCSAGHEWEALSSHRAGPRRVGCPYCSGHRAERGVTDLTSTHPQLAAEWHRDRNVGLAPLTYRQAVKGRSGGAARPVTTTRPRPRRAVAETSAQDAQSAPAEYSLRASTT
ncbi:zinc-ribbon domain-containing protein [Georgenia yuyongxinii]|nr:zinc-ribbon domain-containing protein [Georgenia yuyongxinii]